MKLFFYYFGLFLHVVIILAFSGKIVYLIFKPKFLAAYKVFTDKNLSDFSLGLYYLLILIISLRAFAGIIYKVF